MKDDVFNKSSKPAFSYNPLSGNSFAIMKGEKQIGSYTVLDTKEDTGMPKIMADNLVSALNGKKPPVNTGKNTMTRQLFSMQETSGKTILHFHTLKTRCVSERTATLTIGSKYIGNDIKNIKRIAAKYCRAASDHNFTRPEMQEGQAAHNTTKSPPDTTTPQAGI